MRRSLALIVLPVPLGSKRSREREGGYCVCVTIPLVVMVMWGERAKLVGKMEDTGGVKKRRRGGEVIFKSFIETELIKLTNKRELFFIFLV